MRWTSESFDLGGVLTTTQKKQQQQDEAALAATSKKKKVTPAQLRAQKGLTLLGLLLEYLLTTFKISKSCPSARP